MNDRQKAGTGLIVSGGISIGLGAILLGTGVTPEWVPIVLNIIGFILPAIGLTANLPHLP